MTSQTEAAANSGGSSAATGGGGAPGRAVSGGAEADIVGGGAGWVSVVDEGSLDTIREYFKIPATVALRAPVPGEGAVARAGNDEVCLTAQILAAGLKFPILRLVREVLDHINLAPAQLQPNGFRMIIASALMWSEFFKAEGRPRLTLEEFWYMYKQEKRRDGAWNLHSRIPGRKLVDLPGRVSSLKGVETKFFFVSGDGWEHPRDEVRRGADPVKLRRCWGEPSAESGNELPLTKRQLERLERILAWAQGEEARKNFWNNVDWLLQDVHFEEALGYSGVSSLTNAERAARVSCAEARVGGARSFFPGTQVGVLPPRPQPLRLRRATGATQKKRKTVSVAGSVPAKKTRKAPLQAAVTVGVPKVAQATGMKSRARRVVPVGTTSAAGERGERTQEDEGSSGTPSELSGLLAQVKVVTGGAKNAQTGARDTGTGSVYRHEEQGEARPEATGWLGGVTGDEMRYMSRSPTPVDFEAELSGDRPHSLGGIGEPRRRVRIVGARSAGDASDRYEGLADEGCEEIFGSNQGVGAGGADGGGEEVSSTWRRVRVVVSDEGSDTEPMVSTPEEPTPLAMIAPGGQETYIVQSSDSECGDSTSVEEIVPPGERGNGRVSGGEAESVDKGRESLLRPRGAVSEAEFTDDSRGLVLVPSPQFEFELDWSKRNQILMTNLTSMLRSNAAVGFGGMGEPSVPTMRCPVSGTEAEMGETVGVDGNSRRDCAGTSGEIGGGNDVEDVGGGAEGVCARRSARCFAVGAQRILDEALASLTHLYEERVQQDATETGASVGGTSVQLHYTDAYVGTLRTELSKRRAELHLARSEVLSLRGLFANCSREAGNWREYADQLEQDYDRRGEELRNRTRELDEARAELAVVAAERTSFNADLVRKQEELSGMQAQMAEAQHEVERLHAVEEELAVARREISAARASGEELPLVREELARTKKELAMAQTAGEELVSVHGELAKVRKELAVARIAAEEMPSVREELIRAKEELTKAKEELVSASRAADGLKAERDRAVEDLGVMRRKRRVTKMKFRHVRRVCRQARQIEADLEGCLHATKEEAKHYRQQLRRIPRCRDLCWAHGYRWGFYTMQRLALGTRGRVDMSLLKWDEQQPPARAIAGRNRLFREECPTAFEAE
jgi:uncharacterized coiled-coil DUF342 family protein